MKQLLNWTEALLTVVAYALLRLLPLPVASALGGFVARVLGPRTRVHRVAQHNLRMAMPELTDAQQNTILHRMWDNLGRVFAEYPHLNSRAMRRRVMKVNGLEHLMRCRNHQQPALFISGHLGNWELLGLMAHHHGMPMHLLYRAPNNPVADKVVAWMRRPFSLGLHAKGKQGARAVIVAMRKCEPVAMLVDQKTNDGIESLFFGHAAMTSPAVAELMRYHPVVIPAFCRRTDGAHFEIDVLPPMEIRENATQAVTQQVNDLLEERIRQDPAQWFWVHKRWPHSKAFAKTLQQKRAA